MPKAQKARAKTHKHTPGKFSPKIVHMIHKLIKKADKSPSMTFRRGRTGRGMYESRGRYSHVRGRGVGDLAEDEKYNHMYMRKAAQDMLASGASMKEVKDKYPSLV